MYSGAGDLKTDSKKTVEKIKLHFEDTIFQGRKFEEEFLPWMTTAEVKRQIVKSRFNDKNKGCTDNDIRLFYKNIELKHPKKNPFELHKIEPHSTLLITRNSNFHNPENGVVNPYQLFQVPPQRINSLLLDVQSGLNGGRCPKLAAEGTSGTYFLQNNGKKVAVYKPYDEEPYTPNNPRGYPGEIGSQGIRKGILSGECATREVAAYLLDANKHFHGVPATTYAEFYHPCFNFKELCETPIVSEKESNLNKARTKHGSLQEFIEYTDLAGNLGCNQFSVDEVHKIAILDLRILNCDRNEGNILVLKKVTSDKKGLRKVTELTPIDHGLSFPDNLEIYQYQVVWMGYKQARVPLSQAELAYIQEIDPVQDCQTLREKLGFREICLRNFRIAETFLKKMARAGFSLFQIGQAMYREDDSDCDSGEEGEEERRVPVSELEKLVVEAEFIYNTVKNNGIKSTAEFQMDLIKNKKEESVFARKEFKEITSQEGRLGLALARKQSRVKETSIEKGEKGRENKSEHQRPRNISLPNLKKKPSNRNRRMKNGRKKTRENEMAMKHRGEKWGDLFFHYFEELLQRFVAKKCSQRDSRGTGRSRLMSEDIY